MPQRRTGDRQLPSATGSRPVLPRYSPCTHKASARVLRPMKKLLVVILSLASSALAQNAKHPFTFEDMMKLKRVGVPVPSPDGKWVVFDCVDVDLEANTKISRLWIVPASGGESRRLNPTPNHEERPRFSPDGKRLIWTSKATDPTQIWMCDFDSGSGVLLGKPHQITNLSTGADGGIWSPDGKNIVFVSAPELVEIFFGAVACAVLSAFGDPPLGTTDSTAIGIVKISEFVLVASTSSILLV